MVVDHHMSNRAVSIMASDLSDPIFSSIKALCFFGVEFTILFLLWLN